MESCWQEKPALSWGQDFKRAIKISIYLHAKIYWPVANINTLIHHNDSFHALLNTIN